MKTVLIIDDSPTDIKVFGDALHEAGYEVLTATDGDSGIQTAKEKHPDLIVMDVVMPGINGFMATRLLSAPDSETCDIPILIVTTKKLPIDRVWGLRQGAKEVLTKPITGEQLIQSIETYLHEEDDHASS